ncbi:regulatory particle non-ATPase [Coemansia sp. RSA 1807]|nr:regulatory particle non-ATPase [Coemansia sp. RSA 1591]KAJ1755474.1 regulatory particle non-ATPase [Coemansia sp. RSA 1752]KAJ1782683.1 regulatory particle non-ATPase [Coemansia sp. RSA 1938]KAJ1791356.1 regulatory particle non-ATPase [Coemansia sp. RSA 2167]KAJ2136414.1 regulatory particle non-ATPase [Coemansia sp. RSA 788]KAJ2140711.1 regulatory particle non-ATPase [Coemansia sp. RSA 678]KAJ2143613.1 regulatory particle non-ATPase [Coemansia sp. RSA 564]KAJ2166683.1 regulatory particle 
MSVNEINKLYEQSRAALSSQNPNLEAIGSQVSQLKVGLVKLALQNGQIESDPSFQLLKRSVTELGAELSIKVGDIAAFERYLAQLEPFYFGSRMGLSESKVMYPLIGLNLLRMLSDNLIADFHTVLERIDLEQLQNNPFIVHPVKLEQALMEGSYKKVWQARSEVPTPEYLFFMDILMTTIRNEVASCVEKSYLSLPFDDAKSVLFFSSLDELLKFAQEHQWTVSPSDKRITFKSAVEDTRLFQGENIMKQALSYAQELERIV